MSSPESKSREELLAALLAGSSNVPTSALRRFARTAKAGIGFGMRTSLGRHAIEDFLPLAASLGELKGLAMKLGQILSYIDDTLPPEARQMLSLLQTYSPPASFESMAQVVIEELGARAPLVLQGLEKQSVASASIGQVHRGVLPDGRRVAVKIQYPDIETAIRNDFRAANLAIQLVKKIVPGVEGFVDEARERLLEECDYRLEANWQNQFARWYAAHPILRIPAVAADYSSRRVLTTAWQDGIRFDAWLAGNPPQSERNRLGEALYEFYLGSFYRFGVFNADPHPGNFLFGADGTLVMLDYGCVRAFSPVDVKAFAALRTAVLNDDAERMCEVLSELGAKTPSTRELAPARALLRAYFCATLQDRSARIDVAGNTQMRALLADKQNLLRLRLPGKILFLLRIKFGVHAVLARLGAEANWRRLEDSFLPAAPAQSADMRHP